MARGYSQSRSEVFEALESRRDLKLERSQGEVGPVSKVNGISSEEHFNKELAKKISMTAADRMPAGSVRPWVHTNGVFTTNGGKIAPLSKDLTGFVNELNDPESLSATLAWKNNNFETMALFSPDGKRIGTFVGKETSVTIPVDASTAIVRANGISIHNHPRADLSFSGPDLYNWLQDNYREMIVISPKFAYSIKHTDTSRSVPPGRRDFGQLPSRVQDDFERILYSPKALAETKLLVGRYGWNAKNKVTGEVEKRYGDTHDLPGGIVVTAHMERAIKYVAKKYGFEYTKYPLPE